MTRGVRNITGHLPVQAKADDSVSNLELFFDLVLVFAVTQVTTLMSHQGGWAGMGQGMLVLAVLWYAWSAFAWLTTMIDPDEPAVRVTVFATMIGLLLASLAAPHAFGDDALIFGAGYCAVRVLVLVLFALSPGDIRAMVTTIGPFHFGTGLLILLAGIADGPVRYVLWLAAVATSVSGPFLANRSPWHHITPSHFSERHGAFVIIALGESIVAAGVGLEGQLLHAELLLAAALAVVVAGALWWTYFDVAHIAARALAGAQGDDRGRLARDSYTMLHLPIVAGIVLFALGVRRTLGHVDEPLHLVPAVALCGGLALNVMGQLVVRLRDGSGVSWPRCALAALLIALIPAVHRVDAILGLAIVAAACWALIVYDLAISTPAPRSQAPEHN